MVAKPIVYLDDLAPGYPQQVQAGLTEAGFFANVARGSTVFLKPNLTFPEFRPGVMTSFECVQAVTHCLLDHGYKVIIGESEGGGYNRFSMDAVFEAVGINSLAKQTGARLVNLTFAEPEVITIRVRGRKVRIPIPKLLLHEIDSFITLPVPKIHMNTLVSMSIKNQWGCIQEPTERLRLHPYFAETMFELNRRLPRAHSIIDGRFGLNGSGPMRGDVVDLNWLMVSNDLVAADRVCCRLMQINEAKVRYLQHFKREGWWTPWNDIRVREDFEKFQKEAFYLKRKWTDLPGLACFRSSFLAWLGYHSPVAGFAHWLLYLFREPFYDHDKERAKARPPRGCGGGCNHSH
jgi:uncharacterized protein (DUF362 family)